MRDVEYRIRVRLENEEGTQGFASAVGNVIHQMVKQAEKEGILSAGATIASANLLTVELLDAQPQDVLETAPPEISVGGEVDNSSPES